ncbi:MAG: pentapeptide repeat-containing protein [Thermoleophilia bacterium]
MVAELTSQCSYRKPETVSGAGAKCAQPVYGDSDFCIFHDQDPNKNAEAFQSHFDDFLLPARDSWDFTGFVFPNGLPSDFFMQYSYPTVFFIDAQFHNVFHISGPLMVSTFAHFLRAEFFKDAKFAGKFGGSAIFSGANFHGNADFSIAEFSNEADFSGVRFYERADFSDAIFSHGANFGISFDKLAGFVRETRFICEAIFENVTFGGMGPTLFNLTNFSGEANFSLSRFYGETKFRMTEFFNKANFELTDYYKEIEFIGSKQTGSFGDVANFTQIPRQSLTNLLFRNANLEKALFLGSDISNVKFDNCKWAVHGSWPFKRTGLYEADYDKSEMELNYRQLKKSFSDKADYAIAGDFHIGEMEMERTGLMAKDAYNRFPMEAYRWLSYYGERWLRPLAVLLAFLFFFVPIEMFSGVTLGSSTIHYSWAGEWDYWKLLKDIVTTFCHGLQVVTLQRPDVKDAPIFMVTIGSIIGPAMIAFSLLALRRRFKR